MNRETQVGLAAAILLIGILGAVFLRNDTPSPDPDAAPLRDSRSDSERPPDSTGSPRRADTSYDPPRVTTLPLHDNTITPDTVPDDRPTPSPQPTPQPTPQPLQTSPPPEPPKPPRPEPQPIRVALGAAEPPAPPLPSTQSPTAPPTPPVTPRSPQLQKHPQPPSGRQPGTPPEPVEGDIDRAPGRLRFVPSRHPLAGRRLLRPGR